MQDISGNVTMTFYVIHILHNSEFSFNIKEIKYINVELHCCLF